MSSSPRTAEARLFGANVCDRTFAATDSHVVFKLQRQLHDELRMQRFLQYESAQNEVRDSFEQETALVCVLLFLLLVDLT